MFVPPTTALDAAGQTLLDGVGALRAAVSGPGAGVDERIAALVVCEGLARQVEQVQVELIAKLDTDGVFLTRGYRSSSQAVADLLGLDASVARRRVRVAEEVGERRTLQGAPLASRLPATAAVFAGGEISARHVEVIAEALRSPAARRIDPDRWAQAEVKLAEQARWYRPSELAVFATDLIAALDQDGPGEREDEPEQVNELHLNTRTGKIKGQLDGYTREALAVALDAMSAPGGDEDDRSPAARRADALGEIARRAMDTGGLPERGGERPHLNVIIPIDDLEARARSASLDFGSALHPADLRLASNARSAGATRWVFCDARVVPIVMSGAGQPLDVGRAMRTVPDGLRRAVAARDRGCAFPGCGRPPAWCDVHHLQEWERGGVTALHNCAMVCRFHHRLLHRSSGWTVRIHDGLPEFTPPKWIDATQTARRRPPPSITHRSGAQ